jgi:hypothetical protein
VDVFDLRDRLVADYQAYTRSFIKIRDPRIDEFVSSVLDGEGFWPEPLLQLNPTFRPGGTIDDLVTEGVLHAECSKIFRIGKTDSDHSGTQLLLHQHQREAIHTAKGGKSFVLTSGTGSGKSLTYIVPIVDHVLRNGSGKGIQAIIVYPMNALANSQEEELRKFLENGYPEDQPPVRFARYTGQEKSDAREAIRRDPPDILLTNYMMLELLLTRIEDREIVRRAQGLQFLVFDELHTYRGRQGADVAMLIRRSREAFGAQNAICIGTSATMASGGDSESERQEVARVAQAMFGVSFEAEQVIGETLERATPIVDTTDHDTLDSIGSAIKSDGAPPSDYQAFQDHPLASWIESTFGVCEEQGTGKLIRQEPRRLRGEHADGQTSAAYELASVTGTDEAHCAETLRQWLLQGSDLHRSDASRFPIFAFRLHQFLTRGDTVWATIETEAERHLEISKKTTKPGDPTKPLFPLVFCRHCGTAYYRVRLGTDELGIALFPREDRREEGDDGDNDAYLFVSEQSPWPRAEGQELLDRLPESFKESNAEGIERIRSDAKKNIPESVYVDGGGHLVGEGEGAEGALVHGNFLFCLEPDCGVAYTRLQRSERIKLATLGVDNRSTATTILAVRSLIELEGNRDLRPEARKLLSFTDNRQDASLQAGHFNDFVQIALLRSALHRATAGSADGLRHGDLSRKVFEAMELRFADFAQDPDIRGPARQATNDALRRVLEYFLYRDLKRGWRVTAPNLEDCGLLQFDYDGLIGDDSLLSEQELWESGFSVQVGRNTTQIVGVPGALRSAPPEAREEALRTLLDVMRKDLAVKVDVLDHRRQHDLAEQTKPRLAEDTMWYLDDERDLDKSNITYPRPRSKTDRIGLFISSYGAFGRYLKRTLAPSLDEDDKLGRAEIDETIRFLLLALKRYGIVEQVRSGNDGDDPGYQINADALRWLPGDGDIRPVDRTRLTSAGEIPPEVNQYFIKCYQNFVDLKCVLEAREHTAQVTAEDRQERETRFREGELPLLFCSPTMELGVDISQLNLVNLRNVPPTPANYAQRSGRAGRGGQPALVFTYCAGRSPHDQFFYRRPTRIVKGAVAPPRIDLRNRELIRSHVHAIWMETARPDLGTVLTKVVDLSQTDGNLPLPIRETILQDLRNPAHRATALSRAKAVLDGMADELSGAPWFHENWLTEVMDQLERSFDDACNRWRSLYRAALRQRELHHGIIGDQARPEAERNHSRRLRAQAEAQIRLLTEAAGVYEGDFYSYRYFATEGFLPGYNFPRLPLSAYVPGRNRRSGRDEFVSRPRFLAISEFGPRALIYHEGARYRVHKVNLDFGTDDIEATHELSTATMKRCPRCGYAHIETGKNLAELCDGCGTALEETSSSQLDKRVRIDNLVQLQNVSLKLTQRITCDEEERQRFGYKIVTSYRFPEFGGRSDRQDAEVYSGDVLAMRLKYGDATDLYRINLGWTQQRADQPLGYNLDLERGYWASNQADTEDRDDASTEGRSQRVVPFVMDTKNALVMRFEPTRPPTEIAALQAAFKQAIQQHFQLEPRELSCEPMPSRRDRQEILFYESSEGGAGVLRQLAEDPAVLPALARQALEVCHFDPDTLEDTAAERCGSACYECLLDYANQPDHKDMDRLSIRDFLSELSRAECRPAGGMGSREERLADLRKRCDTKLEEKFLDLIETLDLRLPSDAQFRIPGYYTQPDFFYGECNAAIYVDGPVHDGADQVRDDREITRGLMEMGYIVIRFHHQDDWEAVCRQHPDVFGVPQQ